MRWLAVADHGCRRLAVRPLRLLVTLLLPSLQAAAHSCQATIHADAVTHRVSPLHMGCHSDSGFAHQPRGLYAELIYGASFQRVPDPPPRHAQPAALNGTGWLAGTGGAALDSSAPLVPNGSSLSLTRPGTGATNRGFAAEGLFVQAEKLYDGLIVARAPGPSSPAALVRVALESWGRPGEPVRTLASTTLSIAGGGAWQTLRFSVVPNASAVCHGVPDADVVVYNLSCPLNNTYNPVVGMSDRSAHVCVRCEAQLTVSLATESKVSAQVGYLSLMPGEWGRYQGFPCTRRRLRRYR